jgi:hypothetical protein
MHVAGGRSGICKVITLCDIDLYGVSCKSDYYESLWDLYSFMFPSMFTSMCLLPLEHAELGQMLGTGSDGVFPYCNVTLEQDVGLDVMLEVPRRHGSIISPRNDSGFASCNQGMTLEQEIREEMIPQYLPMWSCSQDSSLLPSCQHGCPICQLLSVMCTSQQSGRILKTSNQLIM